MPMSITSKGASNQELADATCPEGWIHIEPKPINYQYICYRNVSSEGLKSWSELQALCQKTLQSHPSDSEQSVDLFGLEAAEVRGNREARWFQAALEDSLDFSSQSTFQPLYVPVSLRSRAFAAAPTQPPVDSPSDSRWEWEWRWANGIGARQPMPEWDTRAGRLLYRPAEPALRWQRGFPLARPFAKCVFWTRIADPDFPSLRWGLVNVACSLPLPAPPLIICKLTRTRTHAASMRTHAASQIGLTSTSALHFLHHSSGAPIAFRQQQPKLVRRAPSPSPESSGLSYRSLTSTSFEHSFGSNSVAQRACTMTLVLALGALVVANMSALVCCVRRRWPRAGAAPANDREQERMRERAQSWPQRELPRHLRPRHLRTQAVTFALRKQTSTSTRTDGPLDAAWRAIDGDRVHLLGLDSEANHTPFRHFGFDSSPLEELLLRNTATRNIHFVDEHTDDDEE